MVLISLFLISLLYFIARGLEASGVRYFSSKKIFPVLLVETGRRKAFLREKKEGERIINISFYYARKFDASSSRDRDTLLYNPFSRTAERKNKSRSYRSFHDDIVPKSHPAC